MIVIAEYIYYNLSINEVPSTIEKFQREHFDKCGFNDKYLVSVIRHTEFDLKTKTKKRLWSDYFLIRRGIKELTSNGRYKVNRVNELIVIIEGEINIFAINTYLKMKIHIFWRKVFLHIAINRDYI